MRSLPTAERHRQPMRGFRRTGRIALEGSKPAQVVLQVAGGHAVEFPYPCFEPTVIRIDVLNMPRTVHTDTCREVDSVMLNTQFSGRCAKRLAAIRAEDYILRYEGFQSIHQRRRVDASQNAIHRRTGAITGDQNGHLFMAHPRLARSAATLSGLAVEPTASSLEREQEHCLIRFRDAGQHGRLDMLRQLQKAVTPPMRGADMNVEGVGNFVQCEPVFQGFGLLQPLATFVETIQRRATQCGKGAAAFQAKIALHVTQKSVTPYVLRLAVQTSRTGCEARFNHRDCGRLRVHSAASSVATSLR
jgi:hypothetical protein